MPSEDQDPWYEGIRATITAIDGAVFTTREDKNFVLFGGGTVSWNATSGLLEWDDPFEAVAATTGFHWVIPAPVTGGSITLQDGEFFFVELVRAPQSTQSIEPLVGSRINTSDNALVIAQRIGEVVVFRNGSLISHGQNVVLFGASLFSQEERYVAIAGEETTEFTTFQDRGGVFFDPTKLFGGGASVAQEIRFRTILQTTDDTTPLPAEARLWNLTDGAPVAGSVLSSSSLNAEPQVSGLLTLPLTPKVYKVQLRLDDTSGSPGISDQVACLLAELVVTWT